MTRISKFHCWILPVACSPICRVQVPCSNSVPPNGMWHSLLQSTLRKHQVCCFELAFVHERFGISCYRVSRRSICMSELYSSRIKACYHWIAEVQMYMCLVWTLLDKKCTCVCLIIACRVLYHGTWQGDGNQIRKQGCGNRHIWMSGDAEQPLTWHIPVEDRSYSITLEADLL